MKALTAILFLAIFSASCVNKNSERTADNTPEELPAPGIDTMCFVYTEGIDNADSTFVKLIINGKQVDGNMLWFPTEKDHRMGELKGTYVDGIINAGWTYVQEGTRQNLNVSFRLDNGKLFEKRHVVNQKLGIEELPDTGAYTKTYQPIDCHSRFPERLVLLNDLPNIIGK